MNALSGAESIEEYYQLSHDPFATRTPGFKFFTPQRKTVLAQLHHLARYGDRLLLVTGPEGSGKTLLRQVLLASSNKDTTQCVVTTARECSGDAALISFFCQAVNAGGRDPAALMLRAEQLHATGINLYLIVDDAQLLEQGALQELVDLSRVGGAESPIRIFLFADDSIQPALDRVDAEEEGAQWLHQIPLQAYSLDETRDYIAQRLEAAGQGIELLDEEQIQWIHRHSGGWPGRVNEAARQSMRDAMEEHDAPVSARGVGLPFKSILAVVLVAVGIGFAWFMGDRQEAPTTTVLELPDPVVSVTVSDDPQLAELTELNAQPGAAVLAQERETVSEPEAAVAEKTSSAPIEERPATVNLFPSSQPATEPSPGVSSPAKATDSDSRLAAEPADTKLVAQKAAQAPIGATPKVEPSVSSGVHGADWYRASAAGNYVLQVLGSQRREAAKGFIAAHSGVANLGMFETTYQGKPWFVVTQGNYANRQQAQQGVSVLPEPMRRGNPWPRSMADIQQSLD
jgi:DamX protein